ncbi:MAG: helicase-related protein [Pseudomonadota bacterium]
MSLDRYDALLAAKTYQAPAAGITFDPDLSGDLRPHQEAVCRFALRTGRSAAFLDTGLGKTLTGLEWARVVAETTGKRVLMLAPLAVGPQHQREAITFGIDAEYIRVRADVWGLPQIVITNYERLGEWSDDLDQFAGVVLDESSILKSFAGRQRTALINAFGSMLFRLAMTATPAPNDHMELGNHAEFLGVMRSAEMLSRWFVNDTGTASQKWRLKGHAADAYWDWVASWARCAELPSDVGGDDTGYVLPALREHVIEVAADRSTDAGADGAQDRLFRMPDLSATSVHAEKRLTLDARADALAARVLAEPNEPWVVWVETNDEAEAMCERLPAAWEVRGSHTAEEKERRLHGFATGQVRVLVTKPRIAGFGLNWQHCARVGFVGLSFSYEAYYQAIRRCWRFGQTRPVDVHIAMADTERAIFEAITRKTTDHTALRTAMRAAMQRAGQAADVRTPYTATQAMELPQWIH